MSNEIPLEDRKFYKYKGQVFEFDHEGRQDHVITDEYERMTVEEVDRHINPEKYMSDEELILLNRARLTPLEKKQFILAMYDKDLYNQFMSVLNDNMRLKIEYESITHVYRISSFTNQVRDLMNFTDQQVDEFWADALLIE